MDLSQLSSSTYPLELFHVLDSNGVPTTNADSTNDYKALAMDFIGSCVAGPNYERNPTNNVHDPKRTALRLIKFRSPQLVAIYVAAGRGSTQGEFLDQGESPSGCYKCDDGYTNSCSDFVA